MKPVFLTATALRPPFHARLEKAYGVHGPLTRATPDTVPERRVMQERWSPLEALVPAPRSWRPCRSSASSCATAPASRRWTAPRRQRAASS